MKTCTNPGCGRRNPSVALYCVQCQKPLPEGSCSPAPPPVESGAIKVEDSEVVSTGDAQLNVSIGPSMPEGAGEHKAQPSKRGFPQGIPEPPPATPVAIKCEPSAVSAEARDPSPPEDYSAALRLEIDGALRFFCGATMKIQNLLRFQITNVQEHSVRKVSLTVSGKVFGAQGSATRHVSELTPKKAFTVSFSFIPDFIGADVLHVRLEFDAGGRHVCVQTHEDLLSIYVNEFGTAAIGHLNVSIKDSVMVDSGMVAANAQRTENIAAAMKRGEPEWLLIELLPTPGDGHDIAPVGRRCLAERLCLVHEERHRLTVFCLLAGRTVRFGRDPSPAHRSPQDVILRLLPKTSGNAKSSLAISGAQFEVMWVRGQPRVRNIGQFGTFVDGRCLKETTDLVHNMCLGAGGTQDQGPAVKLRADLICTSTLASAVCVRSGGPQNGEVGGCAEEHGMRAAPGIDAVVLSRLDRLHDGKREHVLRYVLLRREATLGRTPEVNAIAVDSPDVPASGLAVCHHAGEFFLRYAHGADVVRVHVNNHLLKPMQLAPLAPGTRIRVGALELKVAPYDPESFKVLHNPAEVTP